MAQLLIVDDEPRQLSTLAETVIEAGYEVDTSPCGTQALDKALGCDYDAMILEVHLPDLDGCEVLNELRRHNNKTPVILVTACSKPHHCIHGLNAGADDFLVKPFELKELLARINALIRRTTDTAVPPLAIGDVMVDPAGFQVWRSGVPVALTSTEFALLTCLAQQRGRTFSREQLYRCLYPDWSAKQSVESNVLDVHVYHLRRKLGPRVVVTRRGMGYLAPA